MQVGVRRYDYASFLIETHADLFQDIWLNEWNVLVANHIPEPQRRKFQRVHALGATKEGRRRYVLAVWGEYARLVVNLPFEKWAENLTRLDLRAQVYECRPDTFERLCRALENAETRNNVESFKTPKRTKNNQRDAGGRGVRYGSRKSDVSSKIYRRGKENPAIETQFQDDKLDAAVLDALTDISDAPHITGKWELLRSRLEVCQDRHFANWLFQSEIDKPLEGLRHEDIPQPRFVREILEQERMDLDEPPTGPQVPDKGWPGYYAENEG